MPLHPSVKESINPSYNVITSNGSSRQCEKNDYCGHEQASSVVDFRRL